MKRLVLTFFALSLLGAAGCLAISGQVPCAKDSDCQERGHACDFEDGFCKPMDEIARKPDASSSADAGHSDASAPVDTGDSDRSAPDSAAADSLSPDAAAPDAAAADSSATDAAMPDSLVADGHVGDSAPGIDRAYLDAHSLADSQDLDDRTSPGCDGHVEEDGGCYPCTENIHCHDDNPCTRDLCTPQHVCEHVPLHHLEDVDAGRPAEQADGGCNMTDAIAQLCVRGLCVNHCNNDDDCSGRICYTALNYCRQCITGSNCASGTCIEGICE